MQEIGESMKIVSKRPFFVVIGLSNAFLRGRAGKIKWKIADKTHDMLLHRIDFWPARGGFNLNRS